MACFLEKAELSCTYNGQLGLDVFQDIFRHTRSFLLCFDDKFAVGIERALSFCGSIAEGTLSQDWNWCFVAVPNNIAQREALNNTLECNAALLIWNACKNGKF